MKIIVKKCIKCGDINAYFVNETTHKESNCNGKLLQMSMSVEEFKIICSISKDNNFIQAMVDLRSKDPVEYQLKMSQFKSQLELQRSNRKQTDNTPKCPHCHSANIQKIGTLERAGSITMLGVFSKKINKSFKCKSCGYTW